MQGLYVSMMSWDRLLHRACPLEEWEQMGWEVGEAKGVLRHSLKSKLCLLPYRARIRSYACLEVSADGVEGEDGVCESELGGETWNVLW